MYMSRKQKSWLRSYLDTRNMINKNIHAYRLPTKKDSSFFHLWRDEKTNRRVLSLLTDKTKIEKWSVDTLNSYVREFLEIKSKIVRHVTFAF